MLTCCMPFKMTSRNQCPLGESENPQMCSIANNFLAKVHDNEYFFFKGSVPFDARLPYLNEILFLCEFINAIILFDFDVFSFSISHASMDSINAQFCAKTFIFVLSKLCCPFAAQTRVYQHLSVTDTSHI